MLGRSCQVSFHSSSFSDGLEVGCWLGILDRDLDIREKAIDEDGHAHAVLGASVGVGGREIGGELKLLKMVRRSEIWQTSGILLLHLFRVDASH